jgi:hypothetical protein
MRLDQCGTGERTLAERAEAEIELTRANDFEDLELIVRPLRR